MRGFRGEQASSQVPVQGLPGQIPKGTGFHPNGKYVRVLPGVFGKHVFVPPPKGYDCHRGKGDVTVFNQGGLQPSSVDGFQPT